MAKRMLNREGSFGLPTPVRLGNGAGGGVEEGTRESTPLLLRTQGQQNRGGVATVWVSKLLSFVQTKTLKLAPQEQEAIQDQALAQSSVALLDSCAYPILTRCYPIWIISYKQKKTHPRAATMKTPFGKELTKIRLDNNLSLKDMAVGLNVPSSYLSAVESASSNGKTLTPEFLERILKFLNLDENQERRLRLAATMSTGEYRIDTSALDLKQLDTLTMFARKIGSLDDKEIEKIKEILRS